MFKRFGTIIIVALIFALIFVPSLLDRCVTFLVIGVVPYTNITLSPTVMLALYATFLALGVYAIANELFLASNPVKRETVSREKARRKVRKIVKGPKTHAQSRPKKRYESVVEH